MDTPYFADIHDHIHVLYALFKDGSYLSLINFFAYLGMGYAAGSIPFGLLFTKYFAGQDIRQMGSGNIGATNVLRTGKKSLAILTLLCDGLKGFLPVYMAFYTFSHEITASTNLIPLLDGYGSLATFGAALGALLGHMFPLWLGFKGGKGVATALGVVMAYLWPMGIFLILVWILCAALTRLSSLSALMAVWALVLANCLLFFSPTLADLLSNIVFSEAVVPILSNQLPLLATSYLLWSAIAAMLITYKHKENIQRLLNGREPKIGQRSLTTDPSSDAQ